MKRTIPTLAVLMAAILFSAAAADAQSARAPQAYPPGPSVDATASGPTGQAAAQTTNVNIVNTPTVNVGNAVTVKELQRTPLARQAIIKIVSGTMQSPDEIVSAPAGQRMVIESVNVNCGSTIAQAVGVKIYLPQFNDAVLTLLPNSMIAGSMLVTGQPFPVHLEVDDSLLVYSFRANGLGYSDCTATFMGYTTPLP